MSSYTVKAGDTLSAISRRFNVSIANIANANGIDDIDLIETGQVLDIPDGPASAPVTLNQSGGVVNVPTMATAPAQAMTFNIADWLKPPKLYYTLAVLALGAFMFTQRSKRR